MSGVIEVQDLTKTFHPAQGWRSLLPGARHVTKKALAGVNLSIRKGEIFGVIGPNGAGKTTLFKIVTGLILPDGGQVLIDGIDAIRFRRDALKTVNMVYGDERSFYWRLSLQENLRFYARLFGMSGRLAEVRIEELAELVGLEADLGTRMYAFSSGMKQRAAIARGLINDPTILLMDEPSRMLDPLAADDIQRLVRERVADGHRTVLLATNLMGEAEDLCNRLTLIDGGTNVFTGTVSELRARIVEDVAYRLHVAGTGHGWLDGLAAIPGVLKVETRSTAGGFHDLDIAISPRNAVLALVIRYLVDRGIDIRSCTRLEPTLDQVFRQVVRQRRVAPLEVVAN